MRQGHNEGIADGGRRGAFPACGSGAVHDVHTGREAF